MVAITIILFVSLLAIVVGRELICWYWKINEGIGLLRSIDARLASLEHVAQRPKPGTQQAAS